MKKTVLLCLCLIWIALPGCQSHPTSPSERPLIGITTAYSPERNSLSVPAPYVDAILANGGIPIVLPAIENQEAIKRYVEALDFLQRINTRLAAKFRTDLDIENMTKEATAFDDACREQGA